MSEVLPFAGVPLRHFYAYPVYQSRDDYKQRTGKEAPEWDSKRAPKYWEHAGLTTSRRTVVYDDALVVHPESGEPMADENGKPYLEPLVLPTAEAQTVNIPPNVANVPGANVPPVPVPLDGFDIENYYLDWAPTPFASGADKVIVRDKRATDDEQPVQFTKRLARLIEGIAKKLGV